MNTFNCCLSCQMRFDLKRCKDKLAFFDNCWPNFFECESIDKLSANELQCSLCLMRVIIDAIICGDFSCSKDKTIQLFILQTYMEDAYLLDEMKQMKKVLATKYEEKKEMLNAEKRHLLKL